MLKRTPLKSARPTCSEQHEQKPHQALDAQRSIPKQQSLQMPERPFDPAEAAAMEIARKNGRVTKRELMAEASVGKMKATEALKTLDSKGMLERVGASTNGPRQYYLPIGIN